MKRLLSILLCAVMLLSLAACGGQQAEETKAPTEAEAEANVSETNAPVASDEDATSEDGVVKGTGVTLILYTNGGSDGRGDWLVERAAQDGFDIQYVHGGGADISNRLIAEKEAPIADVVWGPNSIMMATLKSEGVLDVYVPVWADEVDSSLNDADGYYHATGKQAIVLCYDSNQMTAEEAPTDWLDLWQNEAYHGKYEYSISSKLGGGTPRLVLAGILCRYADPDGDLGISDEGWEQIAEYYKNGVPSEDGVDAFAQIADPESPVQLAQMWSSGIETRDEQYGTKAAFPVPEVGIPFATEEIAVVKGSKNVEEAQRFVDWFGSAQIQGEYAVKFSSLPANVNALGMANEFNQYVATLPAQEIDFDLVAKYIDAWCEKITLEYMP